MARTMIDLDADLVARAAEKLGTSTKKDTVHVALRVVLRESAARALITRMVENTGGIEDEALVDAMWEAREDRSA